MIDQFSPLRQLIQDERYDEIDSFISKLKDDTPEWIESHRILAFNHFENRRLDQASELIDTVLNGSPNLPWALHLKVRLARAQGNVEQQIAGLKHINHLLPNDISVAEALADLLDRTGNSQEAYSIRQNLTLWRATEIDHLPVWKEEIHASSSLYLNLLERTLCNTIYNDASWNGSAMLPYAEDRRQVGRDLPSQAHTMIGLRRLRQLRRAVETIINENVPGDLIETGVWRGGACIMMRGVLAERNVTDRRVIVADSFQGLPPPDSRYAEDALTTFDFHKRPELAVSVSAVRENFERYQLMDEQVVFLEGFFCDSLPTLPDTPLAILRLDGDLYSSTMDALETLYDRVSAGGFIIIDDYGPVIDARRAVLDFRARRHITTPMTAIDGDAVFWRKT